MHHSGQEMNVRVLVVDDSTDLRRLVTAIITAHDQGWNVAGQAADGQQALQAAQHLHPDLILLDLSMPVMDGLEALPRLRESVPDATVVVLTGFAGDAAQDAALAAGAHGYLEKDAMVATLIPRLQTILSERQEHATADPE